MINANYNVIYTHFLKANQINWLDIDLKEYLADDTISTHKTPDELLESIKEDGGDAKLNFFGNVLNVEEAYDLLKVDDFPILLFKSYDEELVPYILIKNGNFIIQTNCKHNTTIKVVSKQFDVNQFNFNLGGTNCITAIVNESAYISLLNENADASPLKKLTSILKLERKDIHNLFFYAIVGGLVGLSIPLGIQSLINFLQTDQVTASGIVLIVLIIAGVLASGVLQIIQLWLMEIIQQRLFARTAFDFINRIPKLSNKILSKYYPPELMNRFFDIVSLQKGLSGVLIDLTASLIQIIFGLLILTFYHPVFIAFSAFLILITYFFIKYTYKKGLESSLKESKYKYYTASWLQQVARAKESFRMYSQSSFSLNKMDHLVGDYLLARKKHFKVLVSQYIVFVLFSVLITGGLLIIGYVLLLKEEITIGQFVASEIIILLIINSIEKLILKIESIYDILTSVEKISQVATLPISETKHQTKINFESNISLKVTDLIINKSSYNFELETSKQKSIQLSITNRNAIDEFIEVFRNSYSDVKGEILLNGISIKLINKFTANANTSIFSDKELLFDGSVKENITFGNLKITDDIVIRTINSFSNVNFLNYLPDALTTELIGGNYTSKQEIYREVILLRSLLKNPKILIVDESLLPINIKPEALVNYINTNLPNCLTIYIKH